MSPVSPASHSSTRQRHAERLSSPSPSLPTSHPLIAELTSLRQQLSAYQRASHQAAIQLQGARLELALSQEEGTKTKREREVLKKEVDILRNNPAPPPLAPTSTALTQLSLAHRRLSSKLDLTESQLASVSLDLSKAQQEVQRLTREREGDRAVLNELRRIEEDREEELEWEKGERRKAEEQKKLCDLALKEYQSLVNSLDPGAVPPEIPSRPTPSLSDDLPLSDNQPETSTTGTPLGVGTHDLSSSPLTTLECPPAVSAPPSAGETISNLLIGQKGVHRLFNDFTSMLVSKDKTIHSLESKIENLEHSLTITKEQLAAETALAIEAGLERDKALRDDASASRVVERYMTFTQKTHATVHMHLDNLRTRSQATATTLRNEVTTLKKQLAAERERAEKLRIALDELSEGMSREAAGRRRETALRLKMLAADEKRARKVEVWLDRVRRSREGAEGAVAETDLLESLLDEGVEAVSDSAETTDVGKDKQRSWRGLASLNPIKKNKPKSDGGPNGTTERDAEQESLARILLAEELVTTLVADLQVETERRMDLERQRVDWLAKEAVEGRQAHELADTEDRGEENGHVMFDLDEHEHEEKAEQGEGESKLEVAVQASNDVGALPDEGSSLNDASVREGELEGNQPLNLLEVAEHLVEEVDPPSPYRPLTPEPSPLTSQLGKMFEPLTLRYAPLQKDLHDLSYALSVLRTSLPTLEPSTPTSAHPLPSPKSTTKRSTFLTLSRQPPALPPASDPTLLAILDGIHEVIEDARVDVEIALADHERVYRGFEALLNVGKGSGKKDGIMDEVREYIDVKGDETDESWNRLKKRVQNVENDFAEIKRIIHEGEGMEVSHDNDEHEYEPEHQHERQQSEGFAKRKKSIWDGVELKTVSIPIRGTSTPGYSPLNTPLGSPLLDALANSPASLASPMSASSIGGGFGANFDPRRRTSNMLSSVGSVGRSFSSSVIGAPRKVSGLASGLYRGPGLGGRGKGNQDGETDGLVKRFDEEDDVE
ncbi:hypothetical protein I317_02544 [Kwoniella heveanensis CBS 569]|nr:hypothetical protein I317_02544 [Kwoniella heveanensis CBS 569]